MFVGLDKPTLRDQAFVHVRDCDALVRVLTGEMGRGPLALHDGSSTFNEVDVPVTEEILNHMQHTRLHATSLFSLLATFGHHSGHVHIEECGGEQYSQLIRGEKVWRFWPPGPKPAKGTNPFLVLRQRCGQSILIPGGWWHKVDTSSNGAVLVGETWPGPWENSMACAPSMTLQDLRTLARLHDVQVPPRNRTKAQIIAALQNEVRLHTHAHMHTQTLGEEPHLDCSCFLPFDSQACLRRSKT